MSTGSTESTRAGEVLRLLLFLKKASNNCVVGQKNFWPATPMSTQLRPNWNNRLANAKHYGNDYAIIYGATPCGTVRTLYTIRSQKFIANQICPLDPTVTKCQLAPVIIKILVKKFLTL